MEIAISKNILSLRKEKNITQEQLANMLGVSTAAVSKWETENAYPDIELLPKIADIFDVSIDFLLGYNVNDKKSVNDIVETANNLSKELKRKEAIELLEKALARYPNNEILSFELARHLFTHANFVRVNERKELFDKAEKLFEFVLNNTESDDKRAWSIHFLASINFAKRDYEKASKYNDMLIVDAKLHPKALRAAINARSKNSDESFSELLNSMASCILEYSTLAAWLGAYMNKNNNETIIKECLKAVKILTEYSDDDFGYFYNDISCLYELIALIYADEKDTKNCIEYLELAVEFAEKYDKAGFKSAYKIFDEIVDEARTSSKKKFLMALKSDERKCYDFIKDRDEYKAIISRLEKD